MRLPMNRCRAGAFALALSVATCVTAAPWAELPAF